LVVGAEPPVAESVVDQDHPAGASPLDTQPHQCDVVLFGTVEEAEIVRTAQPWNHVQGRAAMDRDLVRETARREPALGNLSVLRVDLDRIDVALSGDGLSKGSR